MCRVSEYNLSGVPERLYDAWIKSGLTTIQLAALTGTDRKRFSYYFHGHCVPSVTMLGKMCKIFGVSADYILFGEGSGC